MNRRRFMQGALAVAGSGLAVGLYTWQVEPRWVKLEKRDLAVANLPRALEGRTLVQISDMHIGANYDWRYQLNELRAVQELDPAFVVYTGDFITYDSDLQLAELRAVLPHAPHGRLATAAVLGNHDYGPRWQQAPVADAVVSALHEVDIPVLRNERLERGGLHLVGLDDFWGTNYDPRPVLRSVKAQDAAIVLCHNPDVADEPIWQGYQGWILAGHTHGGQIKPPFLPPPYLPVRNRRYTSGQFAFPDNRQMYISRGLGNRVPLRFNVRPEITLFTLRACRQAL